MSLRHLTLATWVASGLLLAASGVIRLQKGLQLRSDGPWQRLEVGANSVLGDAPRLRGMRDPEFTLIQFGDYECPYCQEAWPEVLRVTDAGAGRVDFAYRHFPLASIHPLASRAAKVQIAAPNESFWRRHAAFLTEGVSEKALAAFENDAPLKTSATDAPSPKTVERALDRDLHMAKRLGVRGTPAYFVARRDGAVFSVASPVDALNLVRYQAPDFDRR